MSFNPICTIDFCGWRSNTLTLQRAGWDISAQQDTHTRKIRLALHHRAAQLSGITNAVPYTNWIPTIEGRCEDTSPIVFTVQQMSSNLRVQYIAMNESSFKWHPIDCFPANSHCNFRDLALHEVVPFRTVNPDAEQIVIAPESVTQVLDILLKCQEPEARKRRIAQRNREIRDLSQIKAQVVVGL